MSKTKDQITSEGRAVFYTVLFVDFRKAAIECGWSIGLHGSMANDMDMMAMPWTDEAKPVEEFINAISDCIGKTIWKDHHLVPSYSKPHGRIVYTLSIGADWYIDLSIMDNRVKLNG